MTGYQEVLTDPSYTGQLVAMTAPQIGNTGCNDADPESVSGGPHVAGFILRDACDEPSNWRSQESLHAYLERHGVVGINEVDTRSLTRHLRDAGSQNAAIGSADADALIRQAQAAPAMEGLDLVARVTPTEPYEWTESSGEWLSSEAKRAAESKRHIVVIDLGIKRNILRCLVDVGCRVTAVPAHMSADDILALDPDGIFVSSGPGDPAAVGYAVATLKALLGKRTAKTYKLKFGHRGLNQPVKDLDTGRVEITTQNHGFVVDIASLEGRARSTHVHLNDGTSEGLAIDELDAFSVQFHPEAAGGPHDSLYLFERFVERVDRARGIA